VDADRSLRLSVGWSTTDDDLLAFETSFAGVIDHLRALRS
jgi:cysteine sulfinate desulfinase/cysteine desulfurase-like protein